jgi:hypothetical protein
MDEKLSSSVRTLRQTRIAFGLKETQQYYKKHNTSAHISGTSAAQQLQTNCSHTTRTLTTAQRTCKRSTTASTQTLAATTASSILLPNFKHKNMSISRSSCDL